MTTTNLRTTVQALVADGKGILAADETVPTVTSRLAALEIESTPDSRRTYREMFFTTPGIAEFISGVIMQDETIHHRSSKGTPLADLLATGGCPPSGVGFCSGVSGLTRAEPLCLPPFVVRVGRPVGHTMGLPMFTDATVVE
ncbi:MAG: class I fructose-bisphosphate aldolase, partial [Acidimicrobiia bacterium]